MTFGKINWLAIIIAVVATMVIGGLWYGVLFAEPWMELHDITMEFAEANQSAVPFVVAALATVVTSLLLTGLLTMSGERGAGAGMTWGARLWIFVILPLNLTTGLFSYMPIKLIMIEQTEHLVGILAMGAILGAMKKD